VKPFADDRASVTHARPQSSIQWALDGLVGSPLDGLVGSAPTVDTLPAVPLQLLPEGFALPPLPYLAVLVLAGTAVGTSLVARDPGFGERHVLALVSWMVAGAAGHVLFVIDAVPVLLRPLFGTPSVYVTAAILGGAAWLAALVTDRSAPRVIAAAGTVVAGVTLAGLAGVALSTGVEPTLPALGVIVGTGLGYVVARVLTRAVDSVTVAGRVTTLAVVAHGVDGVTTAVGVDLLGFGERTPLSAFILHAAETLPTADVLGTGWLFVVVKLAVAAVAVAAVAPTVREAEREGYAMLTVVTAVGLGPGVHNALLFAVAG
jgi:uncharacterized membrane protein